MWCVVFVDDVPFAFISYDVDSMNGELTLPPRLLTETMVHFHNSTDEITFTPHANSLEIVRSSVLLKCLRVCACVVLCMYICLQQRGLPFILVSVCVCRQIGQTMTVNLSERIISRPALNYTKMNSLGEHTYNTYQRRCLAPHA